MSSSIIVAGIDVGGTAKGFHAVALKLGIFQAIQILRSSGSCLVVS